MPATDQYSRNLKTLHVVFAVSAAAMFVATLWMMAADQDDSWRAVQQKMDRLNEARDQLQLTRLNAPAHLHEIATMEQTLQQEEERLAEHQGELDRLLTAVATRQREFDAAVRALREHKAVLGAARADVDLAVRDGVVGEKLKSLRRRFDAEQAKVQQLDLSQRKAAAVLKDANSVAKRLTRPRDAARESLTKARVAEVKLLKSIARIDPPNWFSRAKRTIMQWPIIDGFNSPLKIQQDWLPDLKIKLGMATTARFDRCRTCHLAVDRVEAGGVPTYPSGHPTSERIVDWLKEKKFPQPYATHPRPDLYTTAASPHPVSTFGCTICHEGQGSGTGFSTASHTPNDPHQSEGWEHGYQFKENEFWGYPMYPKRFRETSCLKCHHTVVELGVNPKFGNSAPKLYRGYQLIKKYGCFGCHEIHGFEAGQSIGPDLRLEPQTAADAARIAADPKLVAGRMRKVGPSLRHIATKTSEAWVEYWVEKPKRFRPTTRMPQFFDLTNQHDATAKAFMPVELAGIAAYLFDKSQPFEFQKPAAGYKANPRNGKTVFSEHGCLACHRHEAFPKMAADFGPNLSNVYKKLPPPAEGQPLETSQGFLWLYSWIRNPSGYHQRTKMPHLFIDPTNRGGKLSDPAADIAAFLFQKAAQDPGRYQPIQADRGALDTLVGLYLAKAIGPTQAKLVLEARKYPLKRKQVKGDEVELIAETSGIVSDSQWQRMELNYVGRKTVSRYGCYGCHDIPGFEKARPIGTTLQDWGRKDTTKLAVAHIREYLAQHGEPDGSSTHGRAERAITRAKSGEFNGASGAAKQEAERELAVAYFYNSLVHHGRPGFLWQKLRDPRSYDYEKIETKGYDERLRMPKFPFDQEQIEAIATFVLGLVAEPPAEQYLYRPRGPAADRIEGERLLGKYNCAGCHVLDLPEIRYGVDPESVRASDPGKVFSQAIPLLNRLKPPRDALTGKQREFVTEDGKMPIVSAHGFIVGRPDMSLDPEDREYNFELWENLRIGGKTVWPASRINIPVAQMVRTTPARGGRFAEWLVARLMKTSTKGNRDRAWQMVPPPLYLEGIKVQTPWLYQFLRDPSRIRQITVLRMPRFNMSPVEAQSLANYFAAVDGAPYPYQKIEARDPDYLSAMNSLLKDDKLLAPQKDYLAEAWKTFNIPLCIKCHSLGGRAVKIGDPKKDIRGPDLKHVVDRLRPDWTMLWLYNPKWITPYTSMPTNLPHNQKQFTKLFGGDPAVQVRAIRDALMNYHTLMETYGVTIYPPTQSPAGKTQTQKKHQTTGAK